MNVAQTVREAKAKFPDEYCPEPRCLWRVKTRNGIKPCPKHAGVRSQGTEVPTTPRVAEQSASHPATPARCEKCNDEWGHCRNCNRCSFYLPKNGLCKHCQPSPF